MSRPLMIVGFVFLFSLIIINNLFADVSLICMIVLLVLSALSILLLLKKRGILASVVCLTVTAAYVMMYVFTVTEYKPALEYVGKGQIVIAEALDYPEENINGMSCLMRIKKISGQDTDLKTTAYFTSDCGIEPYETFKFKADIKGISTENETGKYQKSDGIYLTLTVDGEAEYLSSRDTVMRFFIDLRKNLSERINESLSPDVSAFVNAIFLGDKSFMEDETVDAFNLTGASHILAVSGLHISIWVLSFYNLLRKLSVNDKIASVFGIVLYFILLLLIGFRYSVIRAGIMLIAMLCANFFERENDSKNSLGLAVLLICMINPFSVMNNGFLMSVFATLGILVIYPTLNEFMTRPIAKHNGFFISLLKSIISTIAVTLSANIMLIPIYIFSIKTFPIISVVSNLLIVSFSTIIMVTGACVGIFADINILSIVFSTIAEYLGKAILFVIDKLSQIPFASIYVSKNFFKYWLVIALVICALTLVFISDKKQRFKINTIFCSVAFLLSYATYLIVDNNVAKIDLLAKSNGYVVSIRDEDTCVIIDYSGSKKSLEAVKLYMQREFIDNIDLLVCESDSKLLKLNTDIGEKVFMDKSETFSLIVANKVAVNYFAEHKNSVYFEVGNTHAVVTNNTKTDYEKLPSYMETADLLICNNSVPENFQANRYKSILVAQEANKKLTEDLYYENAYSTAKMGSITYRCTDDGNYEIRGAY